MAPVRAIVARDGPSPLPSPRSFLAGRGRTDPGARLPRAALSDSLALGYYRVIPNGISESDMGRVESLWKCPCHAGLSPHFHNSRR